MEELSNSDIIIQFVIDKYVEKMPNGLNIKKPSEVVDGVDAVVVCIALESASVKEEYKKRASCQIVTLEEILDFYIEGEGI